MALIKCPECEKEISDAAIACPHCGYTISRSTLTSQSQNTPLPPVSTASRIGGICCIILGFISIPIALIMGVLPIIGSIFLISMGFHFVSARHGICPYCGKDVSVSGTNCKCPHCRKISVRTNNFLKPVD